MASPYGVMPTEIKQNRFIIGTGTSEVTDQYLDCAAALSACNSKQFHQVGKDGTPHVYSVTIRQIAGDKNSIISTSVNNWRVRNAVKMFFKGWRAQLRHGNIKAKDLATYGRRVRICLDSSAFTPGSVGGHSYSKLAAFLEPAQSHSAGAPTNNWFSNYTDVQGNTVSYEDANNLTEVAVTDAAGLITERTAILTGASGATHFGVVSEYQLSRRDPQTYEEDTPGPSDDSLMTTLFSTAEELSDDILEAVDDFGDWRPYSTASYDNIVQQGTCAYPGPSLTYPDSTVTCQAPLGLVKLVAGGTGTVWEVTVNSIYEM